MKNGIEKEKYYFLLEWKDENLFIFRDMFGGRRLCDLNPYELNELYQAVKAEESVEATKKLIEDANRKKNYVFTIPDLGGREIEVGDKVVFIMPPFCSGDYIAEVFADKHGMFIYEDDNFFDGCRDFFITKNK